MTWTLHEWSTDLRHAARALRRTPGFTVLAVGMLGLAIGVNAGMFGVVNTVLLDPLPYAHADRLVHVAASAPGTDFPEEFGVGPEFYLQYREQSRLLEEVSTYNSFTSTLRADNRVERIRMSAPTNSLYATLGVTPILGRLPVADDENRVAVISYALWSSWFGRDSSVVGRTFYMAGQDRTVIGVMGPAFGFPTEGTMLWISNEIRPADVEPGQFGQGLVARMAPGASMADVATELDALARRLPERFGGPPSYARMIEKHHAVVRPLADQLLGQVVQPLWVLLGAVGIVLLIAWANVANLFLVRAEGRQRDLAVRRALGAGRAQLVRLQLLEAGIVAALAAGVAVLIAALVFPLFLQAAPPDVLRLSQVHLDLPTILFTLLAAAGSALACGAVPALRGSAPDLQRLRNGGRGATRRQHWGRHGLVVAQTALALVLLIGSGLLVRSVSALRQVDPGYDTRDVFTFQIAPDRPSLNDGPGFAQFELAFMDRLRALPGVQVVGLVDNIPLDEGTRTLRFRGEGTDADGGTLLNSTTAAGDYFQAMGISVLEGRPFEYTDHTTALGNVVVSRSAAAALWPGQGALGRQLRAQGDSGWSTVVGVVEDVLQDDFRDDPQPVVYYPLVGPTASEWRTSSPAYVLKTTRAEQIAPEVLALVREVAPEAPMYRVYTMAGLARTSMLNLSFTMLTLGIVAGLALILGAVGLYGVLSYVVAERTREIGVRMALGAQAAQVRAMVVAQGARVVGAGILIGVGVALASTRALSSLLFGVRALDPITFLAMPAGMVAVGLLASYLPARRASNVDPIESLKGE